MENKKNVIVIAGPTASGKTSLSIKLAQKIKGEIISADSMQIYKDMDIGTAKVTKEEMQGIPHHMIDIVEPSKYYSVAEYQKEATKKIEEIISRGKVPIVVGGTGLYIDSLIYEIQYNNIKVDLEYRKELERKVEEQGIETLYDMAKQIDPEAMKKISNNDKKRILRVLEIYHQTGKTKTQLEEESRKKETIYKYHVFAINMEREKLYDRINKRVDIMIKEGLIEEVKKIKEKYPKIPTAMQGLGYKEVVEYIEGIVTKEEMIEKLKMETRRYAKRQLTWFRKNKEIIWLEAEKEQEETVQYITEKISRK